jgi:addiction module HigA family antidote
VARKQSAIRHAVAPGHFIREELQAREWSQEALAAKMGRPYQTVNGIINGHKRITAETAIELGDAFGTSAMMWLNLESAYQLYKASQKKKAVPNAETRRAMDDVRIKRRLTRYKDAKDMRKKLGL